MDWAVDRGGRIIQATPSSVQHSQQCIRQIRFVTRNWYMFTALMLSLSRHPPPLKAAPNVAIFNSGAPPKGRIRTMTSCESSC